MKIKGLYNIPSFDDFGMTLARGLLAADIDLANALILLPNRRSCRSLQTTFLRLREGRALLLPRLVPMGDLSDEDAVGESIAGGIDPEALPDADLDLADAWPRLRRDAVLAELVAYKDPSLSPDHVMALAQELGRLMDQIETEGIRPDRLPSLVQNQDLAEHWQKSLLFLSILYEVWPGVEAEAGLISAAARRRRAVENQIRQWRLAPPTGPVFAAGSTGSIPSTRDLLSAVLDLPQGVVILPGLDEDLSAEAWGEIAGEVTHPQHGFTELLNACGCGPEAVRRWPWSGAGEREARTRLLSRAMLPAEITASETEGWRIVTGAEAEREAKAAAGARGEETLTSEAIATAFELVTLYQCDDDDTEAKTIALALRDGLDRPALVSALVTPDRMLATRVRGHLQRWGIEPDDSAGLQLAETPTFKFACIVLDLVASRVDHFDLLALLHHPLCQLGLDEATRQQGRACLDLEVLRQTASGQGFTPLQNWLRAHPSSPGVVQAHSVLDRVVAATRVLREMAEQGEDKPLWNAFDWLLATLECVEALSQSPDEAVGSIAWSQTGSEAMSAFVSEWAQALTERDVSYARAEGDSAGSRSAGTGTGPGPGPGTGPIAERPLALPTFVALLDRAAQGMTLRSPFVGHPRVLILGGIEARLTSVDRIILGGLNEGTWPAETQPGPWMSRPMRSSFGLPPVERRIGLSAHDFCQAFGCAEVILTRAALVDGGATVPSRFIKRLLAFLKITKSTSVLDPPGLCFATAAQNIDAADQPQGARPPRPKPPVAARPTAFSVTAIERWLKNPYEIYVKHSLRLRPLEPIGGRVDVALRGTVIHKALEDVVRDHPGPLGEDYEAIVLTALVAGFRTSGLTDAQLALWHPRLVKMAQWFAQTEASLRASGRTSPLIEQEVEHRFFVEGIEYCLRCRADRIDRDTQGNLYIVDYKSGSVPSGTAVSEGLSPQLSLEGALIERGAFEGLDKGANINRLEYWQVDGKNAGGTIKAVSRKTSSAEEIKTVIEESWAMLVGLVAKYQNPDEAFKARVVRQGDYIHLARQDEWEGRSVGSD